MDINEIPIRPTADLLMVYIFNDVKDTALGGAISRELKDRGINVNDVVASVCEFIAMWAERNEEDEEDELDYTAGLEPGSWCEDKEDDNV